MLRPLGKLTPTPGTPRAVKSLLPASEQGASWPVHGVLIQAKHDNVGRAYIGSSTLNKGAQTDVLATLAIPTNNTIPSFTAAATLAPNAINLADLYVDVDSNGDGVLVSVLVL